jgi:hypothetical protein
MVVGEETTISQPWICDRCSFIRIIFFFKLKIIQGNPINDGDVVQWHEIPSTTNAKNS